MEKFKHSINITGDLVCKKFEEFKTKATPDKPSKDALSISLTVRTMNGDFEVNYYTDKYKKGTTELSYFYDEYKKIEPQLKDMTEVNKDAGERPSIVKLTDVYFQDNPFKKDGRLIAINTKLAGKFINVVNPKDYDSTITEAKFEVEGVIDTMEPELDKDNVPTGNLVIVLNSINQSNTKNADGTYNRDVFEPFSITPIKMIVDKAMVDPFKKAGYFGGGDCYTKFVGKLINSVETIRTVESQAFGEDVVHEYDKITKRNQITSGSAVTNLYAKGVSPDIYAQLKNKRALKLKEISEGATSSDGSFGGGTQAQPAPQANPYAGYNPFA